jgi:hypothetical protein
MTRLFRLGLKLGLGAAMLTTAATSLAKITWDLKPSGTGAYDWTLRQHWTFDESGGTGVYGSCNGNCSYHSIGTNVAWVEENGSKSAPECLELTTYPGRGTPNPDTVIEVLDTSNLWQRISDDYGGTLQSHARIWIQPVVTTMTFALRVRSYSSAHNGDEFYVGITRRDISKASCTSGQTTIPWVQITDSPARTITLSTFH